MNVKSGRKRIWGVFILLVMAVLAVCTIAFAEGDGSSYSLVIQKKFAESIPGNDKEKIPEEVLEEAKKMSYTFQIEGTVMGDNGEERYSEEITLSAANDYDADEPGWQSAPIQFGAPYNVTVTEITDNVVIHGKDGYYNMSDSSTDATIPVNSRKHEVELKNNSILIISRPKSQNQENEPDELWYHITSRPEDEHTPNNFESLDMIISLKAGDTEKITELLSGRKLCPGIYTIEQLAAPDGYQLQLGERKETVGAGKEGHFFINGTPGELTLTAGGTKGDGVFHYYTIKRTKKEDGDESEFVTRTVEIASGESYVSNNLPKGGYTVTEYTIDASVSSKITMTQTSERTQTGFSTALNRNSDAKWIAYSLNPKNFDMDYIKMVSFGPLYNENNKKLNSSTSYTHFRYGICDENGKISNIRTHSTGYTGNKIIPMNAPKLKLYDNKQIAFCVLGVKSTSAKKIGVSWIEYDEKETQKTFTNVNTTETIDVDDRKWIKIEAPALNDPNADGADQIAYYYTIKDKLGNLIPGTTDKDGTTIKLLPGENIEFNLPSAGSYTIVETIAGNTPVGFTMAVKGMPFGTTEAGKPIDVQVGGERELTISKPAFTPLTNEREIPDEVKNQEYSFIVADDSDQFKETINIKAGDNKTILLPKDGKYTISPQHDRLNTYELNYTDSGAIYGTASDHTGTITFTNVFTKGDYGYRVIHEYYAKEKDGSYTYEGCSQIATRMGYSKGNTYHAYNVSKVPSFDGRQYTHFDEAYGLVDGIRSVSEIQSDRDSDFEKSYGRIYPVASSSSALADSDNDSGKIQRKKYSIATKSSARAVLDEDMKEVYEQDYSIATASSAMAKLDGRILNSKSNYKGIISNGTGLNSEEESLNYEPVSTMNCVDVTEDASQIIILRYYWEPVKYNVIHVYYFRDKNGDHWEGTSGVERRNGLLNKEYTGNDVEKVYDFQPDDAERPYTYTWDKRPQYGVVERTLQTDKENEFAGNGLVYRPNNDWKSAKATKDGNQIIILRYYREVSGRYNIVHEYYYREASEIHDSETDNLKYARSALNLDNDSESSKEGELDEVEETGEEEDDVSNNTFSGTINRSDGYAYTFEGKTELESVTALLGNTVTDESVERITKYNKNQYTYIDAGYGTIENDSYSCDSHKQWATSTKKGDDVIILRYYREDNTPPPPPPSRVSYKVVHEYYLKNKDGSYTKEGTSNIREVADASSDVHYTQEHVTREPDFQNTKYTYFDWGCGTVSAESYEKNSDMQYVLATESGEQIIILCYFREVPDSPPPGNHRRPSRDPDPTPTTAPETPPASEVPPTSEIPPTNPETIPETPPESLEMPPEVPNYPTVLPDPNDPESPEQITILEDGVPKTYMKRWDPETEEWIYIPEDEPPLAALDLPKTGDNSQSVLWAVLASVSLCGLVILNFFSRKRKYSRK